MRVALAALIVATALAAPAAASVAHTPVRGTLRVVVGATWGEIFVDGTRVGSIAVTVPVDAGDHVVHVEGEMPFTRGVFVHAHEIVAVVEWPDGHVTEGAVDR